MHLVPGGRKELGGRRFVLDVLAVLWVDQFRVDAVLAKNVLAVDGGLAPVTLLFAPFEVQLASITEHSLIDFFTLLPAIFIVDNILGWSRERKFCEFHNFMELGN